MSGVPAPGPAGPGAMPANLDTVETMVAGRTNLYIGDGITGGPMGFFGEQTDETPISWRPYTNDVPGDSHGGQAGPPIERQHLGYVAQISFTLSTWSQQVREYIEMHARAFATLGTYADYEIGTLLMSKHCFRLTLVPVMDPTYFTYNFPCALLAGPIDVPQSSKYSPLRFSVECFRAPPLYAKRGVLWDRDVSGISAAEEARQEMEREQLQQIIGLRSQSDQ